MRELITEKEVQDAWEKFEHFYKDVRRKKGLGSFSSKHEIYGALAEEVYEVLQAIHVNASGETIGNELMDIAVVCLFGVASIDSDKVDW